MTTRANMLSSLPRLIHTYVCSAFNAWWPKSPKPSSSSPDDASGVNSPSGTRNTGEVDKFQTSQSTNSQPTPCSATSADQPFFIWRDIYPPAELAHRQGCQPEQFPHQEVDDEPLPSYNDISGPVIVGSNGFPRHLSSQEEQDRQSALESAVRERMLGLSRRTQFGWSRPDQGTTLPVYRACKSTWDQSY